MGVMRSGHVCTPFSISLLSHTLSSVALVSQQHLADKCTCSRDRFQVYRQKTMPESSILVPDYQHYITSNSHLEWHNPLTGKRSQTTAGQNGIWVYKGHLQHTLTPQPHLFLLLLLYIFLNTFHLFLTVLPFFRNGFSMTEDALWLQLHIRCKECVRCKQMFTQSHSMTEGLEWLWPLN